MFELLFSIGSGMVIGTIGSCIKDGVRIRPYHSKKARAKFKRKYNKNKNRSKIMWTDEELKKGPKFWK